MYLIISSNKNNTLRSMTLAFRIQSGLVNSPHKKTIRFPLDLSSREFVLGCFFRQRKIQTKTQDEYGTKTLD